MHRVFPKLLAFCSVLILGLCQARPARGESMGAQITLLDKLGQPTASIIDGNTISLKIQFPDPLTAETQVDFLLWQARSSP